MCKLGLALVGGAIGGLSAIVLLDRTGKGIRTAPRDAMISLTAPQRDLGLAFGVHRAMDTAGAMIGPIIAFALLAAAPNAFSSLFLVSFFIAMLGFLVIALLVREPRQKAPAAERPDLKAAAKLLRGKEFRALTIAGAALGLATASDGFIYLTLARAGRVHQRPVPVAGHRHRAALHAAGGAARARGRPLGPRAGASSAATCSCSRSIASSCFPSGGMLSLLLVLALLGTYYAATDGVLMAMGSAHIPEAPARQRPRASGHLDRASRAWWRRPVRRPVDVAGRRDRGRAVRRLPRRSPWCSRSVA